MQVFSTIIAFIMMVFSFINPSMIKEPDRIPLAEGAQYRAITFNVCYSGTALYSVNYRSKLLIAEVNSKDADIMGFQEATPEWMNILTKKLDKYAYVSCYRTGDESEGAEANPIFYKKDKFTLLDSGTFWLTDTPDVVGSKYPGAGCERISTYVVLEDNITQQKIAVFNTHLDNVSYAAGVTGMNRINEKIWDYIGEIPVMLMGDFNSTSSSYVYTLATKHLRDTRVVASETDSSYTYHDYGKQELLLDYVLASSEINPMRYSVIKDQINRAYISDHYGIYVDFSID